MPFATPGPELYVHWNGSIETACVKAQQRAPEVPELRDPGRVRRDLFAYVAAHPGALTRDIATETGYSMDVVRSALSVLRTQGLVDGRTLEDSPTRMSVWWVL